MAEKKVFAEVSLGNLSHSKWPAARTAMIPEYKQQIIEGLYHGVFISELAQRLDLRVRLINKWRSDDREFNEAYAEAEEASIDRIEKEAVRRAVEGVGDPVIYQGRVVMDPSDPSKPFLVQKYSDSLMMFLLRGRRRGVFGDKREIDATHRFNMEEIRSGLERKLAALAVADQSGQEAGSSQDPAGAN